eukprot:1190375-Prorocentrum_minimum.AAC.3
MPTAGLGLRRTVWLTPWSRCKGRRPDCEAATHESSMRMVSCPSWTPGLLRIVREFVDECFTNPLDSRTFVDELAYCTQEPWSPQRARNHPHGRLTRRRSQPSGIGVGVGSGTGHASSPHLELAQLRYTWLLGIGHEALRLEAALRTRHHVVPLVDLLESDGTGLGGHVRRA